MSLELRPPRPIQSSLYPAVQSLGLLLVCISNIVALLVVAQKNFLALRDLSNKGQVTCIAVSHASPAATSKWIDLMGGAWNVQVIIDEDRAIYAAWGLGLSTVWSYFNPTTQTAAWKEKGWLGSQIATSINRKMGMTNNGGMDLGAGGEVSAGEGPGTIMGNKWQQGGAFAVDERGAVVWGGKAVRADEIVNLEAGVQALGLGSRAWGS